MLAETIHVTATGVLIVLAIIALIVWIGKNIF